MMQSAAGTVLQYLSSHEQQSRGGCVWEKNKGNNWPEERARKRKRVRGLSRVTLKQGHRRKSSKSKNRASAKTVCRCVKDTTEGVGGWDVKVLFLIHTEVAPVHLLLLAGDWRAPPCALTGSLCVSRTTINSLPPPQERGKWNSGFPLSLFCFFNVKF